MNYLLSLKTFALVCFLVCFDSIFGNPCCSTNMVHDRTTIVQLFEWRFDDIGRECEHFLGPFGFGAVQVSPITEHAIIKDFKSKIERPWYERYQPVSYKIVSTSGDLPQFQDMVKKCNKAGVRIYVEVVLNHMTTELGEGEGIGGSFFDSKNLYYSGVPYTSEDFHSRSECGTKSGNIEDWKNQTQVRVCRLFGLNDLDLEQDYVTCRIISFLNRLISFGVAGFFINAANHIEPKHLRKIENNLHNLNTAFFPKNSKATVFHEVINYDVDGSITTEYAKLGLATEPKYSKLLVQAIRKDNQLMKYLKNFGEPWKMIKSENAVVFVETPDTERRVAGVVSYRTPRLLKMATAFMLAWPYGLPTVFSGYSWPQEIKGNKDQNDWMGPPHEKNFDIKPVVLFPNMTCGNGWTCEHRWHQIYNMVRFRNVVGKEAIDNWWDNDYQQIAFSRGDKGFFAINNEEFPLRKTLDTGLPQGIYCDIISGSKEGKVCTGRVVSVENSGLARIEISNDWENPMIAIHVEAKI